MVLIKKLSFSKQVLIIPKHKIIPRGTFKAIYNQALQYIPEEKLQELFYTN